MSRLWFLTVTLILMASIGIAQTAVKLMDKSGATVNPSTKEMLQEISTILQTPRNWGTVDVGTMPPITIPPITVTSGTTPVYSWDILSLINSSTSTLASGATFTGSWHNTEGYAQTTMMVTADQESATNGWVLQHSSDGVNVDYTSTRTYHTAGIGRVFTVPTRGKWIRVLYTNGSSAQGYFRLQTYLRVMPSNAAIQELDLDLTDHVQALVTKSQIVGRTSAGGTSYIPVKVNPSGSLEVNANQPAPYQVIGTVAISNRPALTTVSGSVGINNFPALTTVSGNVNVGNYPAMTTVSGNVNVGNFPTITTVGNFPAITTVSGNVNVGNFPAITTIGNWPAINTVSGLVTDLPWLHAQTHAGNVYYVSGWGTQTNPGLHQTMFASTPASVTHISFSVCASGPGQVGVWEGSSWTTAGASPITARNANRTSANTNATGWYWSTNGYGAWGTLGNRGTLIYAGQTQSGVCHVMSRNIEEIMWTTSTRYLIQLYAISTLSWSQFNVIYY